MVAFRNALSTDLSQENNTVHPKKGKKFSDLVFTRQFTAFDRSRNSEPLSSTAHELTP